MCGPSIWMTRARGVPRAAEVGGGLNGHGVTRLKEGELASYSVTLAPRDAATARKPPARGSQGRRFAYFPVSRLSAAKLIPSLRRRSSPGESRGYRAEGSPAAGCQNPGPIPMPHGRTWTRRHHRGLGTYGTTVLPARVRLP